MKHEIRNRYSSLSQLFIVHTQVLRDYNLNLGMKSLNETNFVKATINF